MHAVIISAIRSVTCKKNIFIDTQKIIRHLSTNQAGNEEYNSRIFAASAVVGIICSTGFYTYCRGKDDDKKLFHGKTGNLDDYPSYTMDEISKHASKESRIWISYKDGVYDITDFVDQHPGGDNILLGAGAAIDPFWNIYGVHKQPAITNMLEKYRIGKLSPEEGLTNAEDLGDPYAHDPKRSSILSINSKKPFNAEPPVCLLAEHFITPKDLFYIRNHLPVPEVDIDSYALEVSGFGIKEHNFTLDDLKNKFRKVKILAVMQCAGNRRSEMSKIKPVKGLDWKAGAIGNAVWEGVLLRDVLKYCGLTDEDIASKARHVQFEGLDTDPANVPYGASIPIEKAWDHRGDVLLAYEMNGEPLSRDHGFPLRVVAPGIAGARSVKWLGRIIVSEQESNSHWQQNDYKGFSPSIDWDTVDFKTAPAIQDMPVVSAICEPMDGQTVKTNNGKIVTKGYAWSGGGRKIVRVDITADKGKSWLPVELTEQEKCTDLTRCWSWVLWKAEIPVSPRSSEVELWVKAVDSSYNTQPESFENIWNLRGVLSNAYHRIKGNVTAASKFAEMCEKICNPKTITVTLVRICSHIPANYFVFYGELDSHFLSKLVINIFSMIV